MSTIRRQIADEAVAKAESLLEKAEAEQDQSLITEAMEVLDEAHAKVSKLTTEVRDEIMERRDLTLHVDSAYINRTDPNHRAYLEEMGEAGHEDWDCHDGLNECAKKIRNNNLPRCGSSSCRVTWFPLGRCR